MFPSFGKAYIEAICNYYHLQKKSTNVESELQRVVGIILNHQLPHELLNMNQSAQTLRELYVYNLHVRSVLAYLCGKLRGRSKTCSGVVI